MEQQKRNFITRHPILSFYILAFLISWLGWFPQTLYARGAFPFDHPILSFLGGVGPTLAAVIVVWALEGRDGPRKLFAPLFRWRVGLGWYLVVFLFWLAASLLALGIGYLTGQKWPVLSGLPWAAFLPVFLTMFLSNVWEEIGWRGFALPRLQKQTSDLVLILTMGLLWQLWHLPLLLNPDSPMSGLPWIGELVFSIALTVLYTWLYRRTDQSLLPVSIFHAMSNTAAFFLNEAGVFVSSYPYVVGVTALAAVAIVLIGGLRSQNAVSAP